MALNEVLAFSSGSAMTDSTSAPGDCLRGLSDSSVGHLIEPLNFQGVAALAALLRPTRTKSEGVPQQLPSDGNTLLPIQQAGHPLKYLTLASGLLTCIWGWRAGRSIERVVARRYADIAYQIRRPDALSARISAFKFLVLGGLVLPGSAVAFASLRMEATHPAGKTGDSQATHEAPDTRSNASVPRRAVLAQIVPVSLQVDMRRLVAAFHAGLSEFVEAVAPSRQKWVQWAAGVRTSQIAGLQRPTSLSSRIATWDSCDASE